MTNGFNAISHSSQIHQEQVVSFQIVHTIRRTQMIDGYSAKVTDILVLLICGFLSSLIIAWLLPGLSPIATREYSVIQSGSEEWEWNVECRHRVGGVRTTIWRAGPLTPRLSLTSIPWSSFDSVATSTARRMVPRMIEGDQGQPFTMCVIDERGWPMRAWAGTWRLPQSGAGWLTHGVIVIGSTTPGGDDRWAGFPVTPIWLGVTFNSLFFGSLWGAVLCSFRLLLRRWRRRHGCCEACGYNLAGLVLDRCSECGCAHNLDQR